MQIVVIRHSRVVGVVNRCRGRRAHARRNYAVLRGLVVIAFVLTMCGTAAAATPNFGVFSLARFDDSYESWDLAMLADGSVVVAGAPSVRFTPDRRRTPIPGLTADAVAATADGGVLGADISDDTVRRWAPGGAVTIVAGRPDGGGSTRDGVPATNARLALGGIIGRGTNILPLPFGAFLVISDGVIKAVDPLGIIRTVAGTGRSRFGGDGGPALQASFTEPVALAPAPDGGYYVADWDVGTTYRIRHVRSDGIVETVVPRRNGSIEDLDVLPDGSLVFVDFGVLWRLPAGGRIPRAYLRGRQTDPAGFAGHGVRDVTGIARDGHGGMLILGCCQAGVLYAPVAPTPYTLAALRDLRFTSRGITATIDTTQPGTASIRIVRFGRDDVAASAQAEVQAGGGDLHAAGRISKGWYQVRLLLRSQLGVTARDTATIYTGRRLTIPFVRRLPGVVADLGDEVSPFLGRRCRAFGPRRVDCDVRAVFDEEPAKCRFIASVTLEASGEVVRRSYPCTRHRAVFRRQPRFNTSPGVETLRP